MNGEILQFSVGDTHQTHTIIINDDMVCDKHPKETFLSIIALDNGVKQIHLIHPRATVTVDDSEDNCSEQQKREVALLCHALCVLLVPIDVGYEFTVYTTTEGEGFVTLCVVVMNLDEGSPRPFVISATTDDGVASKLDFEKRTLKFSLYSASAVDYIGVANVLLIFGVGDYRVCLDINIMNDSKCEIDPIEEFFSDLAYVSGEQPINIDPTRTRVIIKDTAEPECGR